MADMGTSIGGALKAAVELWRRALPLAWAPLVGIAVLSFAGLADVLSPLVKLLLIVLTVPLSAVAYGALLRLALGDLHPGDPEYRLGPAGLQWRGTESRLLGSICLLGLFLILALIGAVFVFMLVSIVTAAATGAAPGAPTTLLRSPAGLAGMAVFAAALLAIIWSATRLSLSTPATVDRNQIQVFSTWQMTRGRVLPLLASLIVIGLPAILLNLIAAWLKYQASCGQLSPVFADVAYGLYALVVALVQTPMTAGATTYFYRQALGGPAPHNP